MNISVECNKLLKCLNNFFPLETDDGKLLRISGKLKNLEKKLYLIGWYENKRSVDDSMWFINESNIVFLYMILREVKKLTNNSSIGYKKLAVSAGIYLAYSYVGAEISYPFKFLFEHATDIVREKFWDICINLGLKMSEDMLKYNTNYDTMYHELRIELIQNE